MNAQTMAADVKWMEAELMDRAVDDSVGAIEMSGYYDLFVEASRIKDAVWYLEDVLDGLWSDVIEADTDFVIAIGFEDFDTAIELAQFSFEIEREMVAIENELIALYDRMYK